MELLPFPHKNHSKSRWIAWNFKPPLPLQAVINYSPLGSQCGRSCLFFPHSLRLCTLLPSGEEEPFKLKNICFWLYMSLPLDMDYYLGFQSEFLEWFGECIRIFSLFTDIHKQLAGRDLRNHICQVRLDFEQRQAASSDRVNTRSCWSYLSCLKCGSEQTDIG